MLSPHLLSLHNHLWAILAPSQPKPKLQLTIQTPKLLNHMSISIQRTVQASNSRSTCKKRSSSSETQSKTEANYMVKYQKISFLSISRRRSKCRLMISRIMEILSMVTIRYWRSMLTTWRRATSFKSCRCLWRDACSMLNVMGWSESSWRTRRSDWKSKKKERRAKRYHRLCMRKSKRLTASRAGSRARISVSNGSWKSMKLAGWRNQLQPAGGIPRFSTWWRGPWRETLINLTMPKKSLLSILKKQSKTKKPNSPQDSTMTSKSRSLKHQESKMQRWK